VTRPMVRPVASSQIGQSPRARGVSAGVTTGTDVPPSVSPSPRISTPRFHQITSSLSDQDLAVALFLADVRLATGHQLARRFWSAQQPTDGRSRAARRALARLERWRVIERQLHRRGGVRGGSSSIVYGLGRSGHRLLVTQGFEPRRLHQLGERYIDHAVAVTEIVVQLAEADRRGELELVGVLETEPQCWRGFVSGYGTPVTLKPDLGVTVGAGRVHTDSWWLEIDRATESAAAIARKAKRYLAYMHSGTEQRRRHVFPRVAFAVPNQRRADQIIAALARLTDVPERLFSVWLFEETVARLAAEAQA